MVAMRKLNSFRQSHSGDVFVNGLLIGCIGTAISSSSCICLTFSLMRPAGMSIPCATQCLLNTIDGEGFFSCRPP